MHVYIYIYILYLSLSLSSQDRRPILPCVCLGSTDSSNICGKREGGRRWPGHATWWIGAGTEAEKQNGQTRAKVEQRIISGRTCSLAAARLQICIFICWLRLAVVGNEEIQLTSFFFLPFPLISSAGLLAIDTIRLLHLPPTPSLFVFLGSPQMTLFASMRHATALPNEFQDGRNQQLRISRGKNVMTAISGQSVSFPFSLDTQHLERLSDECQRGKKKKKWNYNKRKRRKGNGGKAINVFGSDCQM